MINYFIVTKPLQYCNATNVSFSVTGKKHLLIVDLFYGADIFYQNILKLNYWDDIIFLCHSKIAYRYLADKISKIDNLFIDSDYGLKKGLWLSRIKTKNIYVYEEGLGSYRNDLRSYKNGSRIIDFCLRLLGVKEHFGGTKYVRGIYIYDHERFKKTVPNFKNKIYSFPYNFHSNLNVLKEHFHFQIDYINNIISNLPTNKELCIYLTSWNYNKNIEKFFKENEYWIVKPHPHIKYDNFDVNKFNIVVKADIFIELFFNELLDKKITFVVYHENSSALQYFPNIKQIEL